VIGFMVTKYNASDIFQPASFPEYTYVTRQVNERETYESKLRRAIQTKGMLSFVTGASKSGKTVLCHKVIEKDNLIEVSGSHIHVVEDFWIQIAEVLLLPIEVEVTSGANKEFAISAEMGAKAGIPFIADGSVKGGTVFKDTNINSTKEKQQRSIKQIIEYVIRNNKVIVIDDYHYIDKSVQLSIARILKNEIFYGLRVVIISLPHRSDDAIRLNPDLNGRVRFIAIEQWAKDELVQIPQKGFSLLGLEIKSEIIELLGEESITSPQLMQQICLNIAFDCADRAVQEIADRASICNVLKGITEDLQYENIIEKIILGPSHGREKRKQHILTDGSKHDIYYVLLRALAEDPPSVAISMDQIQVRISSILADKENSPRRVDISNTLDQIQKILDHCGYKFEYMEWREQKLNVLDPLFLFYLRWK